MKTKFPALAALILLITLRALGQQAEQIDIKSLTVNHADNFTVEGSVNYVTAAGESKTFGGAANYMILPLMYGTHKFPSVFESNGFINFNKITDAENLDTGGYYIKFYITSSESDPVVLRPTINRKKSEIVVNGSTKMRGRVEFYAPYTPNPIPRTPIAVDNDVVLSGTYKAVFSQCRGCSVRTVRYRGFSLTLNQ